MRLTTERKAVLWLYCVLIRVREASRGVSGKCLFEENELMKEVYIRSATVVDCDISRTDSIKNTAGGRVHFTLTCL